MSRRLWGKGGTLVTCSFPSSKGGGWTGEKNKKGQ